MRACSRPAPPPIRIMTRSGNVNLGIALERRQEADLTTFPWDGAPWTVGMFVGRLPWLGLALFLSLLAGLFFDRFDTTRARSGTRELPRSRNTPVGSGAVGALESLVFGAGDVAIGGAAGHHVHLTPLANAPRDSPVSGTLRAEWKLALRGPGHGGGFWACWRSSSSGRRCHGGKSPDRTPLAWLWPILVWSSLGNREVRQGIISLSSQPPIHCADNSPPRGCRDAGRAFGG